MKLTDRGRRGCRARGQQIHSDAGETKIFAANLGIAEWEYWSWQGSQRQPVLTRELNRLREEMKGGLESGVELTERRRKEEVKQ